MAYKKYIRRNGKVYGPYIYHSRRIGGKVISEYQGTKKKIDYKKFFIVFFGILLISGLIYGVVSSRPRFIGMVTDLGTQDYPQITNLTVTQLHEGDELPHKYELNLGVLALSNFSLNYDWEIDCGDFFKNNESVGVEYSGDDKFVEWHTTGECADARVKVSVIGENIEQELVQSVFTSGINEESFSGDIGMVSEEEVMGDDETEINMEGIANSVTYETIIIEDIFPLNDIEKQILINEFGTDVVQSGVSLFNDRVIVRYELGDKWIENSYDFGLSQSELENQMENDRISWLRDMINNIISEEIQEHVLEGFDENYLI